MRRLLCLLRGHHWHIEENYAPQRTEEECVRCRAHRSTFPGDPGFRPRTKKNSGGRVYEIVERDQLMA